VDLLSKAIDYLKTLSCELYGSECPCAIDEDACREMICDCEKDIDECWKEYLRRD